MMRFFLIFLLVLSLRVEAGHERGNGGDSVICYSDETRKTISSVELFDYWEHESVFPERVDLGKDSESIKAKIQMATERISRFDPGFAASVQSLALGIYRSIEDYLVTTAEIPEVDDARPLIVPASPFCYVTQFAVQWKDMKSGKRRFLVSKDIYHSPETSNTVRAGLILHEALYRSGIINGASNSDGVRFFNYLIATKALEGKSFSSGDYLAVLNKAGLNSKGCYSDSNGNQVYDQRQGSEILRTQCFNRRIHLGANAFIELLSGVSYQVKDGRESPWTGRGLSYYKNDRKVLIIERLVETMNGYAFESFDSAGKLFSMEGPLGVIIPCSSTRVTLSLEGKVMDCNPTAPLSIHGKKHLITNIWLDLFGRGFHVSFSPGTENALKVSGSKRGLLAVPKESAIVSHEFELVSAELSHPIVMNLKGSDASAKEIWVQKNQLHFNSYADYPWPRFEESAFVIPKLEISDAEEVPLFVDDFCLRKGVSAKIATPHLYEIGKHFVSGDVMVFDSGSGQPVKAWDEVIEVYSLISCFKETLNTSTY